MKLIVIKQFNDEQKKIAINLSSVVTLIEREKGFDILTNAGVIYTSRDGDFKETMLYLMEVG